MTSFTLTANDPVAPHLIRIWALLWAGEPERAKATVDMAYQALMRSGQPLAPYGSKKFTEALDCADLMTKTSPSELEQL